MQPIIFALVPVFATIALGHALKRIKFLSDEGWAAFDRMNYYVFFPALIIHAIAQADFSGDLVLRMGAVLLGAVMTVTVLLLILKPFMRISAASFTSVFQCSVRWNGFVGLGTAMILFGAEGVSLVAIGVAVVVPTVNILSVVVLTRSAGTAQGFTQLLRLLWTNPLILGCVAGIFLNISGIGLPGPVAGFADLLGAAALALGLLSVGAGMDLSQFRHMGWTMAFATVVSLLVMPAVVFFYALGLGLTGMPLVALILIGSVPTASSGYVLARQLGGDAPLMAGLVTSTSVFAMITMPFWLTLAENYR